MATDSEFADRAELRTTLRRVIERHTGAGPAAPSRSDQAGGYDGELWKRLAEQVGVAGLAVPESLGGSGAGYRECHLVLEELGRAAVASPFLASAVLATQALLLAGDATAQADLLPDLADGTRTAALVLEPGALTVDGASDALWSIDGTARQVVDGARSDLLLAFAETDSETALFLLDGAHPGLRRTLVPTLDQSLHLADMQCASVPGRRLSAPGVDASAAAARLADLAAIAVTAEQVGGARRGLELTVDYAKQRVQFGRPIGSFQAIKHRLADLLVLVESAQSASDAAAVAWADGDDATLAAALAKSYCSEAYRAVAGEMIQLHGGIGFTWEHPAHRYFKRAHATSALFGDPAQHRQRIAERLGLLEP